jgi:hypothetical protein
VSRFPNFSAQAYYSEERGRTREAYSTSGSAVREFAVNTGVYAAEYFYDRESKWAVYNDFTDKTVATQNPATGVYTFTSTPFKPEDLSIDPMRALRDE